MFEYRSVAMVAQLVQSSTFHQGAGGLCPDSAGSSRSSLGPLHRVAQKWGHFVLRLVTGTTFGTNQLYSILNIIF